MTVADSGLMVRFTYHRWDTLTQDWSIEPFQRILITNDSSGNLTEYLNQDWDGTDWMNDYIVYVDYNNIVGVDESESFPTEYSLKQNYPNPFNPVTTLEYTLFSPGEVSLIIYNLFGQEVARLVSEVQQAGYHEVTWDASNFASGIYFYRLQAGDFVQTRKMVLLK